MKRAVAILTVSIVLVSCLVGALATDNAKGDSSPVWAMFRFNAAHTGQCAYDTKNSGAFKWNYPTGGLIASSPAIAADGTVYIGSDDGCLYALRSDGVVEWKYPTGDHIRSSPAISSDGTIYVGSDDNNLYALNADGTLKWKYRTRATAALFSPTIALDGTIYVGSGGPSTDSYLYAIRPDGSLKWKSQIGGVFSSPAIGVDGTVYVGTGNAGQLFYAIDPDGKTKWRYELGTSVDSSPAIDKNGTIYVGDDVYLYAMNPDGTLKWKYQTGGQVRSSPAIGNDGTVYVGSGDSQLYALNPDGTLKWKYQTGNPVSSSPAIGSDGTIYVGSEDFRLYALNSDGTLKWKYQTGNPVSSSPAIGSDGTVYVGSWDGNLYAIGGFGSYKVTASTGSGGSISPSGTVSVDSGASQSFTVTPDSGYHITDVLVDGMSVGPVSTYSFTNVTADHTISVSFGRITYTITASSSSGGAITPAGAITVKSGESKSFSIVPSSGYRTRDVSVDGVSHGTISSYTFSNVTSNHTISASFEQEKKRTVIVLQIGNSMFTVNGGSSVLDSPPVIKNGRTLVPIRAIIEALGGTVGWDGTARKATVALDSTSLELWIGKSSATVSGTTTPIDSTNTKVVPEIINGRTMLPLRFVSENLGCLVDWAAATKTITITYQP